MKNSKIRLTPLERTAYHEAGHVVANYLVGFEMEYVTLVPDDETLGQVKSNEFKDYYFEGFRIYHIKDYDLVFRSAVADYAGYLCAAKAAGKKGNFINLVDYGETLDLFRAFGISNKLRDSMMDTAKIYTREIFNEERPWELVKLIARNLLERQTLTGREILEIIENSDYRILRKTLTRPS